MEYSGEWGDLLTTETDIYASLLRELAVALESIATTQRRRAGEILFRQGQPADGVLVLRQGKVRLCAGSHDAGEQRVPYRTVAAGYVLGLPALFSGHSYSLTAEALEDCVLGFVERNKALELVHQRVDLCFEAADVLARELGSLREWQATHLVEQSS